MRTYSGGLFITSLHNQRIRKEHLNRKILGCKPNCSSQFSNRITQVCSDNVLWIEIPNWTYRDFVPRLTLKQYNKLPATEVGAVR